MAMEHRAREGYEGSGPGAITPDGCAVELYARLPVGEEPDIIEGAVRPASSILELGSGAGRMTHPLVHRGFAVTAVDESPQMLERISGAGTVRSAIEELSLDARFDVVLLASFLVHAAGPGVREGMLATCRRHVKDDGCVLIQREAPDRHDRVPSERRVDGGLIRIVSSEPVRPGVRSVHVEYDFADARWTQTFLSCPLTDEAFDAALERAGLAVDRYLTADRTWVRVVPRDN